MSRVIERRISFNGGEVSPWIDPRIDLEKYRSSARRAENFRLALYGGAFTRPGTVYVAAQPNGTNAARVVSFEFSATTTLMMVFSVNVDGEGEFTVYTTGDIPAIPTMTNDTVDDLWAVETDYTRGTWVRNVNVGDEGIYYCAETHTSGSLNADFDTALSAGKWTASTAFKRATPYAAEELAELQFQQVNDVIFATHPNHVPHVISRLADNHWTIAPLVQEWPALRPQNTTNHSMTASATTGTGVTITSTGEIFDAGHVGSRWLIKHRRTEPFVELALSSSAGTSSTELFVLGDWSLTVVSGQGTGDWDALALVERSSNGTSGWETVRSMPASRSDRSGIITGTEIDPCYLRVTLVSKDGTTPTHGKYTLEAVDPDHYGLFDVAGFTDSGEITADIVFPLGSTGSTQYWAEPAWSDYRGWPRTICAHEERLMFGGNASQPQTIWGTVIDDFYPQANFRLGADDDMGLALTTSGQKANAIQWMVSQDSLIVGTSGAEGPIGSRDSEKGLTPTGAKRGKFTYTGSAFIQALPVQDTVIFIQRNGRKAWEFSFVFESDGYKAQDLTLLAEHITDGQILQVALQRYPEPIIWCVDSGGQLLGLAYERNQNVAGWFRYTTDGLFESVAVVSGTGEEDQVWVTVNRDGTRFIERFQPDRIRLLKDNDKEHICSSDCSVIYDGAAATTITGLSHLNGQTVTVLANGSPVGTKVVSGGQITLDDAASVVIVGLPYECYLQPTYLETNDPNSNSKVAWKNIHRVDLELWRSQGGSVSANNEESWERLEFIQQGDLMDTAIPLMDGYAQALCDSRSERKTSPIIR